MCVPLMEIEMLLKILDKGEQVQVPFQVHLQITCPSHCALCSEKLQAHDAC